jgi:hypothetical protein
MKTTVWIFVLAALFGGWLLYSVMRSSPVNCEACITYGGRTECAKTAAATEEAALQQAASTICAQLASGMTEVLECQRTKPVRSSCTGEAKAAGGRY